MSEVTFHLSNYTHYYTHISEETPKPTFWCEQSCCHISGRIPTKPGGLCVIIHLDQGKFCHLWFMMREMLTFLLLINVNSINVKTASPFLQRLSLIPLTDCFCPSLSLAQMGCVGQTVLILLSSLLSPGPVSLGCAIFQMMLLMYLSKIMVLFPLFFQCYFFFLYSF